jgi:hypothetical protein
MTVGEIVRWLDPVQQVVAARLAQHRLGIKSTITRHHAETRETDGVGAHRQFVIAGTRRLRDEARNGPQPRGLWMRDGGFTKDHHRAPRFGRRLFHYCIGITITVVANRGGECLGQFGRRRRARIHRRPGQTQ